jgi:hypothetical protein
VLLLDPKSVLERYHAVVWPLLVARIFDPLRGGLLRGSFTMWWQDTPTNYSRVREVLDLNRARTNLGEYYHIGYIFFRRVGF